MAPCDIEFHHAFVSHVQSKRLRRCIRTQSLTQINLNCGWNCYFSRLSQNANIVIVKLHDASEETSVFPNELPAEERERLLGLSEEELADEGWTLSNSFQRTSVSGTSLNS